MSGVHFARIAIAVIWTTPQSRETIANGETRKNRTTLMHICVEVEKQNWLKIFICRNLYTAMCLMLDVLIDFYASREMLKKKHTNEGNKSIQIHTRTFHDWLATKSNGNPLPLSMFILALLQSLYCIQPQI